MATTEITTIVSGPWAGERVRILKTETIGPRVWCKVEKADCPGLTTTTPRFNLAAWDLLQETLRLRDRAAKTNAPRLGILTKDAARLAAMFA